MSFNDPIERFDDIFNNIKRIESYTQKVVLGLVILGAVLIDRIRHA